MCKLCNKPRPTVINRKPSLVEYSKVVQEYIGELPCRICFNSIVSSMNNPNRTVSLDAVILRKLYITHRGFSHAELGSTRSRELRKAGCYQYRSFPQVLGIKIRTTVKGDSRYTPTISVNRGKTIHLPYTSTLEEAVQVKYNYMVANGFTKGLTILKMKLKELQCQNQ